MRCDKYLNKPFHNPPFFSILRFYNKILKIGENLINNIVKRNAFVFISLTILFYIPIFLKVENWPFTDWRVFNYSYHPSKVYVFSLELKSEEIVEENFLEHISFSTVTFNRYVYSAYYNKRYEELDHYIKGILKSENFKNSVKSIRGKYFVNLVMVSIKSTSPLKFRRQEIKSYEFN